MSTERCSITNCVRVLGHAGAHTAAPSARTLDWDHGRGPLQEKQIDAAVTLLLLDFETPHWADLND